MYYMFFLLFQKKTDESLELYRKALEAAKGQKELELMNLYEIGNHSFHIKKNPEDNRIETFLFLIYT